LFCFECGVWWSSGDWDGWGRVYFTLGIDMCFLSVIPMYVPIYIPAGNILPFSLPTTLMTILAKGNQT